jgi:transketolase
MKAQEKLAGYGVNARVVSMPGWNLFAAQDDAYRERILPSALRKRVTVEAAATFGWERWAGDEGTMIGIDHYGASAPGAEIMKHFGLTAEHVTAAALALLNRLDEAKQEYGGETTNVAPTSPT